MKVLKNQVLILNRLWQATAQKTVEEVMPMLYTGVATAIHVPEDGSVPVPMRWSEWVWMTPRPGLDEVIHTPKMIIRAPTVIAAVNYAKIHPRTPKLTAKSIFERDRYICQYCGHKFQAINLSMDHIFPRDRGGPKTWENIVCCCKKCNTFKRNRTPAEAGMRLIRKPRVPLPAPVSATLRPTHPDHEHFLK